MMQNLANADGICLQTFGRIAGDESNFFALIQRFIAVALDRRVMDKHVLAAVLALYEAEALTTVEPLHDTAQSF